MAICPFAVQQLIPETWTQGRITPTTLIYHRAVSNADSLRDYWNSPGVEVESHFYIGRDGTIYQFVDTNVRADANMSANGFAISVETWDGGNTPDSDGWNDAQVAAAKRLGDWVCSTHGIPRRAATSWNGGGIGGHNWFATEWAGGPRGCPGTERNRQLRNDIIPAIASGNTNQEELPVQILDARSGKKFSAEEVFFWFSQDLAKIVDTLLPELKAQSTKIVEQNDKVVALLTRIADRLDEGAGGGTEPLDYDKLAEALLRRVAATG